MTDNAPIYALSDIAALAQAKIQQDYDQLDPVINIRHGLRNSGFPADAMTIDCLRSQKRIILILHDERPNQIDYQFSYIHEDPADTFQTLPVSELTEQQFYQWIVEYFG